jgi:fructose-bisphosphate aldolase class II
MALVNLNDLLRDARKRGYAVGSFNMVGFGFLNGILEAAEEESSPVILSIAEVHLPHMQVEQFVPVALQSAQRAGVPVAVHLDHGFHFETVVKAIRWGFSSVMFDGSEKDFEDNLAAAKLVTRIAKPVGVSVEAELGRVGGAEGGDENVSTANVSAAGRPGEPVPGAPAPGEEKESAGAAEGGDVLVSNARYTDPDLAVRFVKETGVDVLAISVGNAHGFYRTPPKLDFDRIKKIRDRVDVPLALHGGSGIPDESFIRAIRLGISKINYFTAMTYAAAQRIKEFIKTDPKGYEFISLEAKKAIKEVVRERMRVFGSSGRA